MSFRRSLLRILTITALLFLSFQLVVIGAETGWISSLPNPVLSTSSSGSDSTAYSRATNNMIDYGGSTDGIVWATAGSPVLTAGAAGLDSALVSSGTMLKNVRIVDVNGIVNLRVQHSKTAFAGEVIQTTSIVTVSCIFSNALRVDLVDSGTNTVLSSAYWTYNPTTTHVSPPLVNNATAPHELGYWSLSIHAYLASATSGSQFTILIKPNT